MCCICVSVLAGKFFGNHGNYIEFVCGQCGFFNAGKELPNSPVKSPIGVAVETKPKEKEVKNPKEEKQEELKEQEEQEEQLNEEQEEEEEVIDEKQLDEKKND